jgi:hypothetical protein
MFNLVFQKDPNFRAFGSYILVSIVAVRVIQRNGTTRRFIWGTGSLLFNHYGNYLTSGFSKKSFFLYLRFMGIYWRFIRPFVYLPLVIPYYSLTGKTLWMKKMSFSEVNKTEYIIEWVKHTVSFACIAVYSYRVCVLLIYFLPWFICWTPKPQALC